MNDRMNSPRLPAATAGLCLLLLGHCAMPIHSFQPSSLSPFLSRTSLHEQQSDKDAATTAASPSSPSSRASSDDKWIQQDIESQLFQSSPSSSTSSSSSSSSQVQHQHPICGPHAAVIYDTTLRDGTQMESISVSCDDKLKIAARLSQFNVDYIEAGWPGSNPKDEEFFLGAQTELDEVTRSKLVAGE